MADIISNTSKIDTILPTYIKIGRYLKPINIDD